jgi:hypothetical protein
MVFQESEGIATIDTAEQSGHDCPYLNHVEQLLKQAGSDLNTWSMNAFVRSRIDALHVDGECPPTHPGGDMTKPGAEWADHVQTFSTPRSVI